MPAGGWGRAWGWDLILFVGPGVGHLTDLVLPGEGIFKSLFARRGDIWLTTQTKKDWDWTYASRFHASRMRSGKICKSWRPTGTSGSVFFDQLNLCGIKVNGSKEKQSRFLQVQLITDCMAHSLQSLYKACQTYFLCTLYLLRMLYLNFLFRLFMS